jgi:transglutaminase-like putative cysteine protease
MAEHDDAGVDWATIRSARVAEEFCEFAVPSDYVDLATDDPQRSGIVAAMLACPSPHLAARMAVDAVRDRIDYSHGVTNVTTTAREAWAAEKGVCQDFTHATLSLLRTSGIPARYVSGYLHTEEPAPGKTVVGESHAWVEYWDAEWRAVDPTNDRAVGAAHVVVARGRDYADVPPLKGIYAGGASEGLGVSVEITQI